MPYFYLFVVLGLKQFVIASRCSWLPILHWLLPGIGQKLASVCRPGGEAEPPMGEVVDVLKRSKDDRQRAS